MINQNKIDEWIREVEERPASAALIIQYIANRLSELAQREEDLAAQNIELLSGRKVEEYESRIASLEYQLELLKRQLSGEVVLPTDIPTEKTPIERFSALVYTPSGQVLCATLDPAEFTSGLVIARIIDGNSLVENQPTILMTPSQEELLFLFDSGRTVTSPISRLPTLDAHCLDWKQAFIQEPKVKEELAAILPIAKIPLYEACIQASRRGYVKKFKTSYLTTHIKEMYIGKGVKLPADKTCGLTFANMDDLFVMVSQEGFIFSMQAARIPVAIEEVIRLGITDHIVSAFVVNQKPSILFITQSGKAVNRDASWLEPASSYKTKGQPLLSKERRESGTRIVGAAPVDDEDWGAFLHSDGTISTHKLTGLLASGSIPTDSQDTRILSFSCFRIPKTDR